MSNAQGLHRRNRFHQGPEPLGTGRYDEAVKLLEPLRWVPDLPYAGRRKDAEPLLTLPCPSVRPRNQTFTAFVGRPGPEQPVFVWPLADSLTVLSYPS